MTRISMTFATAALTLSLAPAVQANTTAPDATLDLPVVTLTQATDVCVLDITPVLAAALNLPDTAASTAPATTVACNS